MERIRSDNDRQLATLIAVESDDEFREAVRTLTSETGNVEGLANTFADVAERYNVTPEELTVAIDIAAAAEQTTE